jgi:predicted Zn-dependent protease
MQLIAYRHQHLLALALVWVVFAMQGCVTGSSEAFLPPIEEDVAQGREAAKMVEMGMGLVDDPDLAHYLQRVGQRVASANPDQRFSYQFQLVDQYEPNAFALPGGWVFVSRGLLALTDNEAQLANVLGHEVIHVSGRHSARQRSKSLFPALLSIPGALVGAVVNEDLGKLINTPVSYLGGAYLASYSRQDEFEADKQGQVLAARAGYNPEALAPILERLAQADELRSGEQRMPGFFDTHPSTPDRAERITVDAGALSWQANPPAIAPGRDDYLKRLDGLLIGPNPEEGVFSGQTFLHPVLDVAVEYPAGWMTMNARQGVLATNANKDAVMVLGIEGQGTDPAQIAAKYREGFSKKYGIEPALQEAMQIGQSPAYFMRYTDTRDQLQQHLCFLWLAYREQVYRFVASTAHNACVTLRATALSFRPMTSDEKASITETRLHIVTARSGETLSALSSRSGNQWGEQMTAVMNGFAAGQPLQQGQRVKVAITEPYLSGS